MAKCAICNNKIESTFLGKIIGTIVKKKGTKKTATICPNCQKQNKHEDIVAKL